MNKVLHESAQTDILLSIITVTRNDADRLSQTIQSLQQFYGDARFEHIVMDGGSTDHTMSLASSQSTIANFRFYSGSDKGIYDAMNQGIQKSKGKFLLFLNCGDCMLATPDDIAAWSKSVGDEAAIDIVCFAFAQIESNGAKKIISARKTGSHQMPTSHQAMLFSAEFIHAHPYNIRYKIAADYDLYVRSRPNAVAFALTPAPLTAVEVDGVASSQPLISYREYLVIVSKNMTGMKMVACMTRIALKALLVIAAKSILPQGWISKLRGMS